jgi:serine/threonine protein kinase
MQPVAKEEVQKFKYVVKFSDSINSELNILNKLQGHPNIVNIVPDVKVTGSGIPNTPYYVMEYCTEGNCYTFIGKDKYNQISTDKDLFSRFIRNFISDTYSAIKYIHSKGVIHCDIKSKNIFINRPENPNPKLAYADTVDTLL